MAFPLSPGKEEGRIEGICFFSVSIRIRFNWRRLNRVEVSQIRWMEVVSLMEIKDEFGLVSFSSK